MTLIFNCVGQSLMRSDDNIIAENSFNYLKARFDLDESWNGLAVKACFKNKSTIINMTLIDGVCDVPWEVLKAGEFRVSIFGTIGEGNEVSLRATSNEVKVSVEAGPSLTGQNSAKPTPNDVQQITNLAQSAVDKADAAVDKAEAAVKTATSVREEADSGDFNAKISSVSAESVPHGTPASVTNVGTGTDAKLVFKIPEGKEGKPGEPGKQGPAGDSFYAFFTEEEIAKYIEEKNPEIFKGLWLGETNEAVEFGGVYEFAVAEDGEITIDKIGSLRGPKGPDGYTPIKGIDYSDGKDGADGESSLVFSDTTTISIYAKQTKAQGFSFIWGGDDLTPLEYATGSINLMKGSVYGCKVVSKKIISVDEFGNFKGANGVGISRIERTSGNGAAGTTDAYTITLTDNTVGGTISVYNGKDGINAHLTGKPVYGIHNADDIADLVNVLEDKETAVFARNLGDTFVAKTSDNALVTINKNSVYHIQFVSGTVQAIILVEQDNVEGMLVQFEDTVAGYTREVLLLNGLNAPQGGGTGGSGEYELIKSLTVTETEFNAGMQGLVFNLDKDNNPFSLKAVTCICEFPPASKAARLSLDMMTSETSGSTIYRRGDVLSTSETRYCRISARLEGYWIGESVHGASNSEATVTYGTWARNKRSGKLSYIRLTSDVTLPVGTKIEVFGVRA